MFISEIFAAGVRCFGVENALTLKLRRGLNILVGPNDAGKTVIIDAPRYVRWTRGDEFVRIEANDLQTSSGHQAYTLSPKNSAARRFPADFRAPGSAHSAYSDFVFPCPSEAPFIGWARTASALVFV
jgi:predicted ATP-binding protein involved in virulence